MKTKSTVSKSVLSSIKKRDGSVVSFDKEKIAIAVEKAMRSSGEFEEGAPEKVASAVAKRLIEIGRAHV